MTRRHCPNCGWSLTRARSSPDHRRFFALIQAAFDSWPETHDFAPTDPAHLRAWLLCKAGFRDSTMIQLPDTADAMTVTLFRVGVEAAVAAAGGVAFVTPYQSGVAVLRPRSIAWARLDQAAFGDVRSRVEDVLARELGISPDDLLPPQKGNEHAETG